jgi:hypothetical protein
MFSAGAAVFTLRLRAEGHLPFPDSAQPDLVARVTVGGAVPAPEHVVRLGDVIDSWLRGAAGLPIGGW